VVALAGVRAGRTGRTGEPIDGRRSAPSEARAPDVPETRAGKPARIEGVVSGPEGPVWNARVSVHAAGERTAFDETGTDADGRFRIEVAVAGDGESLDLHAQPSAESPLHAAWSRGVVARPGARIVENFSLAAGKELTGTVRFGFRRDQSDRVAIAAVPSEVWSANPGMEQAEIGRAAAAVVNTAGPFRFKDLADGEYVLVCVTPGHRTSSPPRGRPGQDVTVEVSMHVQLRLRVVDADTFRNLAAAEVSLMPEDEAEPPVRLTPSGREFELAFWSDPARRRRSLRFRVEADGYFPRDYERSSSWRPRMFRFVELIPRAAARATFELTGGGASRTAELARVGIYGKDRRGHARNMDVPVVERADSSLACAMPKGRWEVWLGFDEHRFSRAGGIELDVKDRPVRVRLEIPAYTLVEFEGDRSRIERIRNARFVLGEPVWERVADGRFRLGRNDEKPRAIAITRFLVLGKETPLALVPGAGWLAWARLSADGSREPASREVVLEPGARVRAVLD